MGLAKGRNRPRSNARAVQPHVDCAAGAVIRSLRRVRSLDQELPVAKSKGDAQRFHTFEKFAFCGDQQGVWVNSESAALP